MGALRAVFFDLDGTLVRYHGVDFESSWGAIAAAAGVSEASSQLLQEFLPKRSHYADWVRRDAELLAGIPVSQVAEQIFPPPLADGVRDVIDELRGRYLLGIVSSGVALVADRVCDELGLDFAIANHLQAEDGRFSGESVLRVDLWGKADVVRSVVAQRGLSLADVCYVGDHINDIPVMEIVGLSIAVHAKDPAVEAACDHVAPHFSDIPELIARHEEAVAFS